MKTPRFLAALLVTALAATASTARAQDRPTGVDVQQFRPGPGASDYLDILGGFTGKHLSLAGGFLVNHATGVLLTDRDGAGDKVDVVDSESVVDLLVSMSFFDAIELGVALPVIIGVKPGAGWAGADDPDEGMQVGDMRVVPKITIVNLERAFALAVAVPMSLPTGHDFGGYGAFSIEPTLVGDFVPASYFRMTVNVGGRFREDATLTSGDLALGKELTWGLGLKFSFLVGDQPFSVVGAFSGSFELPDQDEEVPPFEFVAGLEWRGIPGWAVTLGAGAGLTRGYGAPDSRVVFGVRYSSYSDCPYGPEDYDHFEDDDGCADWDNDQDGILDEADLCPNEPETVNGVDDQDGCPDRVLDLPEVKAGDASPLDSMTADDDHDGIVNGQDACPGQAEDFDGFLDEDGCPDADNDGDGVLDADDRCPLLAETPNGFEDDDG
ncbi:MAG: cell envelope biogenesis protein OmpA, partial [Myxococcales bacterium]|nr:cell envelope biogenesis protein OmpA [Myxococcales bacterium]